MITRFPIDDALALSTQAGWNQTRDDWIRLVSLAGDGVKGVIDGGRLVSTATGLAYGTDLAWIGMVLTEEAHRGRGLARRVMRDVLDDLERRGVRCVKLDATELGRPVYLKLGFREECAISRWRREARAVQAATSDGFLDAELLALDGEAFGADRSPLLRSLAEVEGHAIPGSGFAMARPGRTATFFGPCVARDAEAARQLLASFLARHGSEPTMLDLCDDHAAAVSMASDAGFAPVRRLTRMVRGDSKDTSPLIYTCAGFEFG